jgi:hypothetical protein
LSSLINTYAKGRFVELCRLPLGTDSILVIPLKSLGSATDAILQDCANLAAVFTAGAVEADFTGYSRKVLSSPDITVTFNTSSNNVTAAFASQVWSPAGGANNNSIVKVVIAYRPAASTNDAGCLVLATEDFTGSTNGASFTINPATLTAQ